MAILDYQRYTPEEYLAFEREVEYKNEYIDGQIVAMTSVNLAHNTIGMNLIGILAGQLRDGPAEVLASSMRLKISARNVYTYADLSVVCDEPELEDRYEDTLLNPTVLIEVLSPSTETYDRGAKFEYYRQLPSLQEYILIAQDRVLVEHYVRTGVGWMYTDAHSLDDTMRLPSIECDLPLAEVYRKVSFKAA